MLCAACCAAMFTTSTLILLKRRDGRFRLVHYFCPRFDLALLEARRSLFARKRGESIDLAAAAFLLGLGGFLLIVLVAVGSALLRGR